MTKRDVCLAGDHPEGVFTVNHCVREIYPAAVVNLVVDLFIQ